MERYFFRKRKLFFLKLILILALTLTGCDSLKSFTEKNAVISDTGFFFDTVVKITVCGTKDTTILKDCFQEMAMYESLLSRTLEGSDIWNINHSNGEPVEVSEVTADLLNLALYYSELSEGVFDPTIASVVSLWNFTDNPTRTLPDASELTDALSHVDYRKIRINGNTVTLEDPDASIDLGGIAKGYIADQLKAFLINKGVTGALINLGGNNLAVGTKPDNQLWKIGIQKPFGGTSDLVSTLAIDGKSVVTSGVYERYFERDGEIYHHILDTGTGYPVQNNLHSVTILSDFSGDGDALSTICFALGLERGLELIESVPGAEAMFITEDETIYKSSGFPE